MQKKNSIKKSDRIYLSLEPTLLTSLKEEHLTYIKTTGQVISLQEYIRKILLHSLGANNAALLMAGQ